jgi:hypothetical protein
VKTLILILSLISASFAFADDSTLNEEQNEIIMNVVCEQIVTYYALGSGWDQGYKYLTVQGVLTTKSKEGLALTVETWKTEDALMSPGPKYSYFCYRCDDGNFKASSSGPRSETCK